MKREGSTAGRWRLAAVAVAAVVVTLAPAVGVSAKAARASEPRMTTAFKASTSLYDTCQDGAACTHSASADDTGAQAAASSIERAGPFAETEYTYGMASGSRTLTLRAPAPAVRLTYTWRTVSATSTATATGPEGAAVGRVFARGAILGCSGCETSDDPTNGYGPKVVDSYAHPGQTISDEATAGEVVTHTFTVRGAGGSPVPSGRYTLRGSTLAISYVGCVSNMNQCLPELIGHSGSASTDASMQLLDIKTEVLPA